jgi:hypothetical protein
MMARRGAVAGVATATLILSVFAPVAAQASPASGASKAAPAGSGRALTRTGVAPAPKSSAQRPGYLAPMDAPGSRARQAAQDAASVRARSTGRAVPVSSLTTQTTTVTAEPRGDFLLKESVLPVRVRQAGRWVPVSTSLRRSGGMLAASAVPDDNVRISDGGSGPLVTVGTGAHAVSLWWPKALPRPAVSGSAADFRGVVPGVDLIVTATSALAGGVSLALEVHSAAAARDPALAHLALRVTSHGLRVSGQRGGGLVGAGRAGGARVVMPAAQMWDSGHLAASAMLTRRATPAMTAAVRAARAVGATIAPAGFGSGGASGPAGGARVAPVTTTLSDGGSRLALGLDAAMLNSLATTYPVFAGPSLSYVPGSGITNATVSPPNNNAAGDDENYDPAQSACPTATNEDNQHNYSAYWALGVGYLDYDCNGADGYAYAYYQLKVPAVLDGSQILSGSTIKTWESWSYTCSDTANVSASLAPGLNSNSTWDNLKAGSTSGTLIDTESVGPDTSGGDTNCGASTGPVNDKNCGPGATSGQCANYKSVVFDFSTGSGTPIQNAADGSWNTLSFRLWEQGQGNYSTGAHNETYFKQFSPNPWMQVYYDNAPNAPSEGAISTGGSYEDCLGSSDPTVGNVNGSGVTMQAKFTDPDGDEMTPTFRYKIGSGSWTTVAATGNVSSGNKGTGVIPAATVDAQADGANFYWEAEATDGTLSSGYSSSGECTFTVYPTSPPPPTISAASAPTDCPAGTPAGTIVASCRVSFTITSNDTAADPATEVVWGLDQAPPATGPPDSNVVDLNGTSTSVTVIVPSPGPHALYAYVVDQAGNDSAGAAPQTFSASADSWPAAYSSFTAALSAGEPFDNTMISTTAGKSGGANADGMSDSLDEAQLKAAGWQPGGSLAVDGATFTLPNFGSSTSGSDNILAAGQTIDLPAGSQGSSLVILATSTDSDALAPLYGSAGWPAGDNTAPYVAGNTPVTGAGCDVYQSGQGLCTVPSGSITYTSTAQAPPESYSMIVPDWITASMQFTNVLQLPAEDTATGQSTANLPMIYAFSVPLNPAVPVSSVTLPDIGDATELSSGIGLPALHILGIAVANTTTATPGTTAGALTGGQTWTGTWESPSADLGCMTATCTANDISEESFRTVTTLSAGGSAVRLRLTNDLGWGTGGAPLDITGVSVGEPGTGPAQVGGTVSPVTFGSGDSTSVTVPEGGDVYSNPVTPQNFTLTAGSKLTVTIYLQNSMTDLVQHPGCSACTEWVSAPGSGNQTTNTSGTPFTGTGTYSGQFSDILSGVDVQTADVPTAIVLGDNVTEPGNGTTISATAPRVSDDLSAAEIAAVPSGGEPAFSVVSAGMEGNELLDNSGTSNPSALARLASGVLAEPNVGTVVVNEGLEDLTDALVSGDETTVANKLMDYRYPALFSLLQAWGVTGVAASLTPCYGFSTTYCTVNGAGTTDGERLAINQFLVDQYNNNDGTCPVTLIPVPCQYFDDFDAQVATNVTDGSVTVEQLIPADSTGDDVNLSTAGYAALEGAIDPTQLTPNVPPDY